MGSLKLLLNDEPWPNITNPWSILWFAALGTSIGLSAFSIALNTYFKEKRGRAMGMSMTITGLGPIFVPHLTSLLLPMYDSDVCMK